MHQAIFATVMRIGINICGFLMKDEGWNEMVEMLFQQLAKNWPAHEFVFIVGKNATKNLHASSNISTVILPEPSNNALSLKLWYDYKLPSLLKKEKVDVLVNPDGVCSLRSNIPQVLFVKDTFFLATAPKIKHDHFIKKRFEKSLLKANSLVVFIPSTKIKLLESYALSAEKIEVANFFSNPIFKQMDWQEKDSIKEKHSEGKEFFLVQLDENFIDPMVLLKAFSVFKKRQQSNMQLLMVGKTGKAAKDITTKLASYKYRNEVKMLEDLPASETVNLLAAAYCLLHPSTIEIDLPQLKAMQVGVPSIILTKELGGEMPTNVALVADANNPDSIAEQMKTIYKDENLRSRIIAAGLETANSNTLENCSEKVFSTILKVKKEI